MPTARDKNPIEGALRLQLASPRETPLRANKKLRRSYDESVRRDHPEIMTENTVAACTLIHLSHQSGQWEQLDATVSVFASSGALLLRTAFHALEIEVAQTTSEELLFRCDSFCTSYLGAILRRWGRKFLRRHVAPIIKRIDALPSLEIDPAVLGKWHPELEEATEKERPALQECLLDANRGRLTFIANEFLEHIKEAIDTIHPLIAFILLEVYNRVHAVFPRSATRALGAILFLRFIFPAFTLPDHHEMVTHCSAPLRRKLVIVAKLLQCVFNEVPRRDEEYFMPLAPFIAKHMDTNKVLYEKLWTVARAHPAGPLSLTSEGGSRRGKLRASKRRTKEDLKQIMTLTAMFVRYADESAQYASRKDILAHLHGVWQRQAAVTGEELCDVPAQLHEESRAFLKWLRSEIGGLSALSPHTLRYHSSELPTPRLDGVLELCQALMRTGMRWETFQRLLSPGEADKAVKEFVHQLPHLSARTLYLTGDALLVPALQHLLTESPILYANRRLEAFFQGAASQSSDDRSHGPYESAMLIRELYNLRSTTLARLFVLLSLWEVLLRAEGEDFVPVPAVDTLGVMLFGQEESLPEGVAPFLRTLLTHRTAILNALPSPTVWSLPESLGSMDHTAPDLEPMRLPDWQLVALGATHEHASTGEQVAFPAHEQEIWRLLSGRVTILLQGQDAGVLYANDCWMDLEGRWAHQEVAWRVEEECVIQRLSSSWLQTLRAFQPALYTRLHFALTQSRALRLALTPGDLYLPRRAGLPLSLPSRPGESGEERVPLEVFFSDQSSQWISVAPQATVKSVCESIAQSVERGVSFREKMFARLYEQFVNPVKGERQCELLDDQWTVQTILTRAKYAQDHRLYFVHGEVGATGPSAAHRLSTAFVVAQMPCRFKKNKGTLFVLPHHVLFQRAGSSLPEKEVEGCALQSIKLHGEVVELTLSLPDSPLKLSMSSEGDAQSLKRTLRTLYAQLGEDVQCSPMMRSATSSKLAVAIQAYQPIDDTGITVHLGQTLKVLSSDSDRLLVENETGQYGFVPRRCLSILSPARGDPHRLSLVERLTTAEGSRDIVGQHVPGVEEWQKILASAQPREVPPGEVVLYRGEASESVYWVVEGSCEALREAPSGEEKEKGRALQAGDAFGFSTLFVGFVPHDVVSRGCRLLHVEASFLRALFAYEVNYSLAARFFAWAALELLKVSSSSSSSSSSSK